MFKLEFRKDRQKPRRQSSVRRRVSSTELRRTSSDSGGSGHVVSGVESFKSKPELTEENPPVIQVNGRAEDEDLGKPNGRHEQDSLQNGAGIESKSRLESPEAKQPPVLEYQHKKYKHSHHDSDTDGRSKMAAVGGSSPEFHEVAASKPTDLESPVIANFHETFAKFKRSYLSTKCPSKPTNRPSATVTSATAASGGYHRPNPLQNWSKLLEQSSATIKTEPLEPAAQPLTAIRVKDEPLSTDAPSAQYSITPAAATWDRKDLGWDETGWDNQQRREWQPLPPAQYKPEVDKVFKRKGSHGGDDDENEESVFISRSSSYSGCTSPKKRPKLEKFILAKPYGDGLNDGDGEEEEEDAEERRRKEHEWKRNKKHSKNKHRSKDRDQDKHSRSKDRDQDKYSRLMDRDQDKYSRFKDYQEYKEYKLSKQKKEKKEIKKEPLIEYYIPDVTTTTTTTKRKDKKEKKKRTPTYEIVREPDFDLSQLKTEVVEDEEEEEEVVDIERKTHKKDRRRDKERKKKKRKDKKQKRVKVKYIV